VPYDVRQAVDAFDEGASTIEQIYCLSLANWSCPPASGDQRAVWANRDRIGLPHIAGPGGEPDSLRQRAVGERPDPHCLVVRGRHRPLRDAIRVCAPDHRGVHSWIDHQDRPVVKSCLT
jgi:hypothetical protein